MLQMNNKIFNFLQHLNDNNNKTWFNQNKPMYEDAKLAAHKLFHDIYQQISTNDEVDTLKMYRIHKDLRFSNDKTPYKTHFGAIVPRLQPRNRGSYYIHLAPGNCFIAAGFWGPNAPDLLRIRKEIQATNTLNDILQDKKIQQHFGSLKGDQLSAAPRGFRKDAPNIELIKHKQFYLSKNFDEQFISSPDFAKSIAATFEIAKPFLLYMTEVVTTDENGVSLV